MTQPHCNHHFVVGDCMWFVYEGMLCNTKTKQILSPQDYGIPLFYEEFNELHFSDSNAIARLSLAEFEAFYQDYQIAQRLCQSRKIMLSCGRYARQDNLTLHIDHHRISLVDCQLQAELTGLSLTPDNTLQVDYHSHDFLKLYRLVVCLQHCNAMLQQHTSILQHAVFQSPAELPAVFA